MFNSLISIDNALASRQSEAHHRSSQPERRWTGPAARPTALALNEDAFNDKDYDTFAADLLVKIGQEAILSHLNVWSPSDSSDDSDTGHTDWRIAKNYNITAGWLQIQRAAVIQRQRQTPVAMPEAVPTSEASPTQRGWLQEALQQLGESSECAVDEGLSPPSDIAIRKTEVLLREMSECIGSAPDVYPMRDSCLAIDFRTPDGRNGVLFIIDQDGSGALFYPTRSQDGWTSVEDATDLFKKRGADELKRAGIR